MYHWSLGNQRCAGLLFIVTKPSRTKWAYTDSSTLTYAVTRHTMGGILPGKATNLGFLFRIDFDRVEVPLILFTGQVGVTVGISGLCCFVSCNYVWHLLTPFVSSFCLPSGVEPDLRPHSHTEENLAELSSLQNVTTCSSLHSSDLEWDDSFVSADEIERRQLLGISASDSSVRWWISELSFVVKSERWEKGKCGVLA